MAAALWQAMLIVQIGTAAAVVALIARGTRGSLGLLIALWLAAFVLLQALAVLIAFLLSGVAAHGSRRPLRVRTIATESAAFLAAAVLMSAHRSRQNHRRQNTRPRDGSASGGHLPPVLLIHGILCNGGVWRPLVRRMIAAGFDDINVLDLYPLFADIEAHAAKVVQALCAIQHRNAGARVVIVAHSMGGLVARTALRQAGSAVIARIITLGTPHHGTAIACRVPLAPTRQMCPNSNWLRRLNADQEGRFDVPVTSLYSPEDTLIAPPGSAMLVGARAIAIEALGHLALVVSPRALREVLDELRRE